jgi:hypothetical protein
LINNSQLNQLNIKEVIMSNLFDEFS